MGTRRILSMVAAGAVLLAGCGGGGDSDEAMPDTVVPYEQNSLSLEEWQAQTTAVCEEYEPKQAAVVARHGQPHTAADVAALLEELTPVAKAYREALEAIEIPAARKREIERTHELYGLTTDAATEVWDASVQGDESSMQQAAAVLDAHGEELSSLLTDLGVPACI